MQNTRVHKHPLRWLLWWCVTPAELAQQVTQYETLPWYQSARCISFWMIISSIVIGCFVSDALSALLAMVLYFPLALCILFGKKWASLIFIGFWTLDRALGVYLHFTEPENSVSWSIIFLILFWSVYMHAFYVAYRTEKARQTTPKPAPQPVLKAASAPTKTAKKPVKKATPKKAPAKKPAAKKVPAKKTVAKKKK